MGWGRKELWGFLLLSLGMTDSPEKCRLLSSLVLLLLSGGVGMETEKLPESI